MHCHCGTNKRAPRWTFTDPCKPEASPGAREDDGRENHNQSEGSLATDDKSEGLLATDNTSEGLLATDDTSEGLLATDDTSEGLLATDDTSEVRLG